MAHVIVTGWGSGVGADTVQTFAAESAPVTILGRTMSNLQAQNLPFEVCDVTDPVQVEAAFARARTERGPVTAVIANAGAARSVPFHKMTVDDLNAMTDVNLRGVFTAWQAGLADMRAAGAGRLIVIVIASTAGLKGYPYVSGYCAAKHGVVGLTRALAIELASTGITVNAVCPGFVDTPMLDRSAQTIVRTTGKSQEEARAALRRPNPQNHFVEVAEVTSALLWLYSDAARSVNGHALSLSGGEI